MSCDHCGSPDTYAKSHGGYGVLCRSCYSREANLDPSMPYVRNEWPSEIAGKYERSAEELEAKGDAESLALAARQRARAEEIRKDPTVAYNGRAFT